MKRPATPLPILQAAIARDIRLKRDADYLIHAAKAYPDLVVALRDLCAVAATKIDDLPKLRAAQALLRELKEAP